MDEHRKSSDRRLDLRRNIDRSKKDKNVEISAKKIKFTFEQKKYCAYEGDTISSALIRNGISNFREDKNKNHRGVYCNMGICNECIVEVNGNQSIKACTKKISDNDNILIQKYPEEYERIYWL